MDSTINTPRLVKTLDGHTLYHETSAYSPSIHNYFALLGGRRLSFGPINEDQAVVMFADEVNNLKGKVMAPEIKQHPVILSPEEELEELFLIRSVLTGFPQSMARNDAMRAINRLIATRTPSQLLDPATHSQRSRNSV